MATTGVFRVSIRRLGGGGGYHYPQHVWTPAGGWWPNPPNWKNNTAVAFGVVGTLFSAIFMFSAANERRPMPPMNKIVRRVSRVAKGGRTGASRTIPFLLCNLNLTETNNANMSLNDRTFNSFTLPLQPSQSWCKYAVKDDPSLAK